jgi:glycogen debranching enzyme
MPADEVRDLLPNLRRALGWIKEYADPDGDGFLEYVDESGHGLANQGWKDSADAVQWPDGAPRERTHRAVRGPGLRVRRSGQGSRTARSAR